MKKRKIKRTRYSRRSSVNARKRKILPTVLIIFASAVLLFGVAVGLGAYLKHKADSYTPRKDYGFEDNTPQNVGDGIGVYAPNLDLGDSVYGLISKGYTDISVGIGSSDKLFIHSNVADGVSGVENGERDIESLISDIHYYEANACLYFYSTAFEIKDENLRRIRKAYEISLMSEMAKLGADDILILGVGLDDSNISEVARYISDINSACGDCSVGMAVSVGALRLAQEGKYLVGALLNCADYVALDLRNLSFDGDGADTDNPTGIAEYLSGMKYYLSQYGLRLVFSEENKQFFDEVYDLGLTNAQVVKMQSQNTNE